MEYVRVKRARGIHQGTSNANARWFRCDCFSPEFVPSDADGGANSVFSEKTGNTRDGVEEKCRPRKSQTVPNSFLYYRAGRQVKISEGGKQNGNQREDQSQTQEL